MPPTHTSGARSFFWASAFLGAFVLEAHAQYTDIARLGTSNAISRPGPQDREQLRRVFETNRADYEKVLQEAGWPGDVEDLFRAVARGSFSEALYPVGHTFEWMAIRRSGVAQSSGPVRWAGADPFPAFEIRFESSGRAHRFLVPKACGNLALVDMGPTEADVRRERERDRLRRMTPRLRVHAPEACAGTTVTADVGLAEEIPEGGRLRLTLTHPDGRQESLEAARTGSGHRWQGRLDRPGSYRFTAIVESPAGTSEEATQQLELQPCPPSCVLELLPPADPRARSGIGAIDIDMCSSEAQVGSLVGRSVEIHHAPAGGPEELIATLSIQDDCRSTLALPDYGRYRFEATVTDDRGMSATCAAEHSIPEPERSFDPFFTVFAGNERRWRAGIEVAPDSLSDRSAPLAGGTIGLSVPFAGEAASIFGQGGVAANLRDGDNTSVFADIGIDKRFGAGYIGGGIGVWDVNHGDTFDGTLFLHGGLDLRENLQWNFEGRLFLSMLDEIANNYVYLTGIRYFWRR